MTRAPVLLGLAAIALVPIGLHHGGITGGAWACLCLLVLRSIFGSAVNAKPVEPPHASPIHGILVTSDEEGAHMFEFWGDGRKVTIYPDGVIRVDANGGMSSAGGAHAALSWLVDGQESPWAGSGGED